MDMMLQRQDKCLKDISYEVKTRCGILNNDNGSFRRNYTALHALI